jgi:hypothetical protein
MIKNYADMWAIGVEAYHPQLVSGTGEGVRCRSDVKRKQQHPHTHRNQRSFHSIKIEFYFVK